MPRGNRFNNSVQVICEIVSFAGMRHLQECVICRNATADWLQQLLYRKIVNIVFDRQIMTCDCEMSWLMGFSPVHMCKRVTRGW
jgi:hypothetical protein